MISLKQIIKEITKLNKHSHLKLNLFLYFLTGNKKEFNKFKNAYLDNNEKELRAITSKTIQKLNKYANEIKTDESTIHLNPIYRKGLLGISEFDYWDVMN